MDSLALHTGSNTYSAASIGADGSLIIFFGRPDFGFLVPVPDIK